MTMLLIAVHSQSLGKQFDVRVYKVITITASSLHFIFLVRFLFEVSCNAKPCVHTVCNLLKIDLYDLISFV